MGAGRRRARRVRGCGKGGRGVTHDTPGHAPVVGMVGAGQLARMTSQAQAEAPMPGVRGLVFLGFPLHAAGKPSDERAAHLERVALPMLFLQGTRDALADLGELQPLAKSLGKRATLTLFQDADHSFHVPAKSGRTDAEVRGDMLDALAAWIAKLI